MKKLLLSLVLLLSLSVCSIAQVTIAPTSLFIDESSRFGSYMVINNSQVNQEISIEFVFSYSASNEEGARRIVEDDSVSLQEHSIAEHVRAFPENFVLNPGQRQVVRLRIAAPSGLEDGTYWARIKTKASQETPPVEIAQDEAVSANLGLIIEQVTGLYYKVGDVNTGILVDGIRTNMVNEDIMTVYTDYSRTGNSPFLGTIFVTLEDEDGQVVAQNRNSTTLYFDGTNSQDLNVSSISSGEYTLRIRFETLRSDISSSDLVQMNPVSSSTTITIP